MADGSWNLSQMVVTAILSMPGAWVAAKLALRGALHQKQWERKEAAYTRLIDALHEVRQFYDVSSGFSLLQRMSPDEERIRQGRADGWMTVEKAISTGGWHMSGEVGFYLRRLKDKMEPGDPALGHEPNDPADCGAWVWEAINAVVEIANKDLKIHSLITRWRMIKDDEG